MSKDAAGSLAFYPKVTGWNTQKMEGMDYTMWTSGGAPIGGLMQLPDAAAQMGAPTHWTGYMTVNSLEETLARATAKGAQTLVPPTDILNHGRFATFMDPQGAAIALYSWPDAPQDQPPQPANANFSWAELYTSDLEAAWAFYSELFGWTSSEDTDMGPAGKYRLFSAEEGKHLGGLMKRPPEMPVSAWTYYVSVPNLDSALAAAKDGGAQVLNRPMAVPGGDWIAQLMDPQGGMFALHSRPAGK
jgi:predicted enzyme related to lactoylglutathione lyase